MATLHVQPSGFFFEEFHFILHSVQTDQLVDYDIGIVNFQEIRIFKSSKTTSFFFSTTSHVYQKTVIYIYIHGNYEITYQPAD